MNDYYKLLLGFGSMLDLDEYLENFLKFHHTSRGVDIYDSQRQSLFHGSAVKMKVEGRIFIIGYDSSFCGYLVDHYHQTFQKLSADNQNKYSNFEQIHEICLQQLDDLRTEMNLFYDQHKKIQHKGLNFENVIRIICENFYNGGSNHLHILLTNIEHPIYGNLIDQYLRKISSLVWPKNKEKCTGFKRFLNNILVCLTAHFQQFWDSEDQQKCQIYASKIRICLIILKYPNFLIQEFLQNLKNSEWQLRAI